MQLMCISWRMSEKKPSPDAENPEKKQGDVFPLPKEIRGYADQGLLEPTRYGDWDVKGRCSDF